MVDVNTEGLGGLLRSLLRPGMTVVDVGSGGSELALLMAERVGPSGRVVVVGADPDTTHALRRDAARPGGAQIDLG